MSSTEWFYAYHLTELCFALAVVFLLIVIFYRCWSYCVEIERRGTPYANRNRTRFAIRYLVSPCKDSKENPEAQPLTQAHVNDEEGYRGRLVDAYSLGPRVSSLRSSTTSSSDADSPGDPMTGRPVRGTSIRVKDYSLDMPPNKHLVESHR